MYKKIDIHLGPTLALAKLEHKRLCPCGLEYITAPLGKTYDVDLRSVRWAKFRCGGCGKEFPVRLIDVWDAFTGPAWFPLDCLDVGAVIKFAPLPEKWEPVHKNMVAPPWRKPGVVTV